MKKIFKLMMLALVGTFALASCEDVPIPYATPNLPNKDQQNANAIVATCAEAATLTNELADGATSSETYCVTGYITDVFATVSNNQQTFWMADTKDGGKVLQAYWANLPEGINMFVVGTKVKITGKLLKYVKNDAVTPEIKNATVEILEDNGDEPGTPDFGEVEGDGKSIETAYNIAGANAICASLEKSVNAQSKYLSEEVYVKGIVSKIDNVDTGSYGNATYFISADGTEAGQFEIYRGYALGGEKFKSADEIKVGDNVVVCGNLVNWMGTYEFNQGSKIVKLNDKTASEEPNDPSSPGEPSGNATDISCAQAVALTNAMDENETTDETYAITGYITEVVGNVSRNQQTFWMADTKDGGNVFEAYYANLPAGLDKFVVGTKVKITGNILKYVNRDGDVTPEIKNADVEILEKAEGDNTDDNTSDNPDDISGGVSGNSITFSTMGYENALDFDGKSITVGDAVVAFSKGSGSTTPKYYNTGTAMRLYGGNTMKISSTKSITKITFKYATGEDQNKRPYYATASNISVSPDSYDYATQTWSGNSKEITVNYTAQGGHVRILGLEITYAN